MELFAIMCKVLNNIQCGIVPIPFVLPPVFLATVETLFVTKSIDPILEFDESAM